MIFVEAHKRSHAWKKTSFTIWAFSPLRNLKISIPSFWIFWRWMETDLSLSSKSPKLRKKCPSSELFWSAFLPHFPAFGLNTERYSWIDGCFYRKRFFTTNHFFQMQEKLEMCQNSNFTNPKRHVLKDHFLEMNIINEYNKYI